MKSYIKWFLLSAVLSVLIACSADVFGPIEGRAATSSQPNAVELNIVADNWEFDQEEYTVNSGEAINFILNNERGYHEIRIHSLGIEIKPGQDNQYVILEPGEYMLECSVPCGKGHLTMKSKLIVV